MKREEEAKAEKEKEQDDKGGKGVEGTYKGGESADDEGESTEVEELGGGKGLGESLSLSGFEEGVVGAGREKEGAAVRQRKAGVQKGRASGDLSGEISTDSEWEKVEDGR